MESIKPLPCSILLQKGIEVHVRLYKYFQPERSNFHGKLFIHQGAGRKDTGSFGNGSVNKTGKAFVEAWHVNLVYPLWKVCCLPCVDGWWNMDSLWLTMLKGFSLVILTHYNASWSSERQGKINSKGLTSLLHYLCSQRRIQSQNQS